MSETIRVSMSSSGRLTIPADARRALGITGETELDLEVGDREIVLRLHLRTSGGDDDSWAYMPEHAEKLRRALSESAAGQVVTASEEDLRKLAPSE